LPSGGKVENGSAAKEESGKGGTVAWPLIKSGKRGVKPKDGRRDFKKKKRCNREKPVISKKRAKTGTMAIPGLKGGGESGQTGNYCTGP